ncbi:type II toxin-antitoxin system Phd/YefM family antitoxin [Roseiflexus sp.]|uniref:type II toxin-antitoxin system Phd/YefM family antitoxin n=1 Tax=Roseiflexus sp. TaxID=2562120 RepID=UPI00398AF5E8
MYRTVSATEARIRFGEIMRLTKQGPVIIEHGGKPEVVVMSKQQFDALMERTGSPDWRKVLDEVHEFLERELDGRTLPDPAEMLRRAREERDEHLLSNLR